MMALMVTIMALIRKMVDGDEGDAAALSGHGDNGKYSLAVWTLWDGYFLSI